MQTMRQPSRLPGCAAQQSCPAACRQRGPRRCPAETGASVPLWHLDAATGAGQATGHMCRRGGTKGTRMPAGDRRVRCAFPLKGHAAAWGPPPPPQPPPPTHTHTAPCIPPPPPPARLERVLDQQGPDEGARVVRQPLKLLPPQVQLLKADAAKEGAIEGWAGGERGAHLAMHREMAFEALSHVLNTHSARRAGTRRGRLLRHLLPAGPPTCAACVPGRASWGTPGPGRGRRLPGGSERGCNQARCRWHASCGRRDRRPKQVSHMHAARCSTGLPCAPLQLRLPASR